jgi:2-polyprenyl-6-methoxyphenol hydroxylase-like FAD-dependent oxidoreductase
MSTAQQVVIVGAGPAGLALASELRRLGTSALLLDKLPVGQNTSRATIVHARTLEVLEPLAVSERLIERGLVLHTARMYEGDKELMTISFDGLDTDYSYMLVCTQDQTEEVLGQRLTELGGEIVRPAEVTAVAQDADGATVTYTENGETKTVRTQWLVGCDGIHSVVRESAGIGFEGGNYDENFVLADVELEWTLGREAMVMFFSPEGFLLVVPLPHGRYRVIATVPEAPSAPSMEDVQRIVDARGPSRKCTVTGVVWSSRFRLQHRVATALHSGRMLICGDAAHVHSPAGGQGMNTGVQDAVSLAGALHEVITTGDAGVFDSWEKKRLEIARSVVKTTDLMTKMATTDSTLLHSLRNVAMGIIGHVPAIQHKIAEQLSEIKNR